MDETTRRIHLAEELVMAYRRELGVHLLAAACYGSVAHGRADAHSDLEIIVLTDASIKAVNVHQERYGIAVECDVLPVERLLCAAQVVTGASRPIAIGTNNLFGTRRVSFRPFGSRPWPSRLNDSRTRFNKVGGPCANGPRKSWRWLTPVILPVPSLRRGNISIRWLYGLRSSSKNRT